MKVRSYIQILNINIRSKDIYHERPLLTANDFIYDSVGRGRPIYISSDVMSKSKLPEVIPLYYGHRNKRLVLGKVSGIQYNPYIKSIVGNIEVAKRWQGFVLDKIREGINGISVEFKSYERTEKLFDKVMNFELQCACIIDRPANHSSKI